MSLFEWEQSRSRKTDRDRLLQTRLKARAVRIAQLRVVGTVLTYVFVIFFLVQMAWRSGEWLLEKLVYQNDDFKVTKIDIQSDGILSSDYIKFKADVSEGDNIFKINLQEVKRDLELSPLIESASIERVLPSHLRIRISEREPKARVRWFRLDGIGGGIISETSLISTTGHVIPSKPLRLASEPQPFDFDSLPFLHGIRDTDLKPGHCLVSPQVVAAIQLIDRWKVSDINATAEIARVDLSQPRVLLVTTTMGQDLTFGLENFDAQLRRLRMVEDVGTKSGKQLAFLDLSVANNLPVRWREHAFFQPPTKRLSKPSRYKKKHV